MVTEKKFRTKTGFCHVTEDKIILTRDGFIGGVSEITVGNNIIRILTIYGFISIGLLYLAYKNYINGDYASAIFFCLLGTYLTYGIFTSFNNSATPIIERKDIKRVVLRKAIQGLTRSRFEVEFSENGKIKRRLIMLPGSLSNGKDETEIAVQIMKEENLLS